MATVDTAHGHERARRYDLARKSYEEAVRDAPDPRSEVFARRELASALIFWGEYTDAEAQLEQVVRIEPGHAAAWHDLGLLKHRRGDLPGAETALRTAVKRAPQDPRPRVALAALLVTQRRYPEALAEYESLLELDLPDRLRAAVDKGMQLLRSEMQ